MLNLKNILLINDTSNSYGGAETYCLSLKSLLEKNGYRTKLITGEKGIKLTDSFFSRWYSNSYYKLIKKTIQNFSPDIIHVHNISRVISPSVLVASALFDIPIVQTVHDYHYVCPKLWMIDDKNKVITKHDSFFECLFHHLPKKNMVYAFFQSLKAEYHKRFLAKYVDHFICPSKNLADWYSHIYGAEKVTFLPNFVEEISSKYTSPKGTDKLLYVGRLSKEKGIELLIYSFSKIIIKYPKAILTIVGSGSEYNSLVKLCKNLDIGKSIKLVGKAEYSKLRKYYESSDVIIIPSIWMENCPMVALEAVVSRRPIIGSNAGGLNDIIRNDFNGLLFDRGNSTDLVEKINTLLSDKKLIKKLSNNQNKIAYKYEDEYHFNNIIKLYKKLKNVQI